MNKKTYELHLKCGHYIHCERFIGQKSKGTILLVNGAFATISSLKHTIEYLIEDFDVIAFDLPFSGKSKIQDEPKVLPKTAEVEIVCEIIELFEPDFATSMSWGGVSLLLALAQKPASIRRAVIGSFAAEITPPMRSYLDHTLKLLSEKNYNDCAQYFNNCLGEHLPKELKSLNVRYLRNFAKSCHNQIEYHVHHILSLNIAGYQKIISNIEVPMLFINGSLDIYTSSDTLKNLDFPLAETQIVTIANAGHFLDMESTNTLTKVKQLITEYFFHEHQNLIEYA